MSYQNDNKSSLPQRMKRSIHMLPSAITAFSLSCGLFIIYKICFLEEIMDTFQLVKISTWLLFLGGIADVLDGAVARFTKTESEFGMLFDSLSDSITFGVAPAVVVLNTIPTQQKIELSFLITISVMIYSLCGALRLVRYNVNQLHNKTEHTEDEIALLNKHFTGLPIPAAAMATVSTSLFIFSPNNPFTPYLTSDIICWIQMGVMIFLGYFMISRWKFPSLKALRFPVPSVQVFLMTSVIAIFILYGVYHYFSIAFALGFWVYIALAIVLNAIRFFAGKKSKTLEEYEPEAEDF